MMSLTLSTIHHQLSKPTPIYGLKLLWVITILIALLALFIFFFLLLCVSLKRAKTRRKRRSSSFQPSLTTTTTSMDHVKILLPRTRFDAGDHIHRDHEAADDLKSVVVLDSGCAHGCTTKEIEEATDGLCSGNVIGSGDCRVVFRGALPDGTLIVVKKLLFCNSGRVNEFRKEAEALCAISHRNLVKFMGYSSAQQLGSTSTSTSTSRVFVVYELVENGSLNHWLHHSLAPLSWNVRIKIILGIAKGLAYLHEDIEPARVHQKLKSANILLDMRWNPKISDYAFSDPQHSDALITPPPLGISGYIAPEYYTTHVLDNKSDVYSFGVLIMEIVSGQPPIKSTFLEIEEYLVDWIKYMVSEQKVDMILDPKLMDLPSMKEVKRVVLIALRCVDPEAQNRPKMGEIIHMLEPYDLLLNDVRVNKRKVPKRAETLPL